MLNKLSQRIGHSRDLEDYLSQIFGWMREFLEVLQQHEQIHKTGKACFSPNGICIKYIGLYFGIQQLLEFKQSLHFDDYSLKFWLIHLKSGVHGMHVGMCSIFQNPGDKFDDQRVYSNEVALAESAEPLGFESIWTVEHHFTNYTMCPDPMQFLTYMAAKTEKIKLGSMVVVLPWHDPIRVAEQISMLDTLSSGRLILGLGRGAGRVEFDAFRQDMADSRNRFIESAECVLNGLENGICEYQGKFVNQPKAAIRPQPSATFKGRTYAAAVSPESIEIMAKLGIGLLVIPQKPWNQVEQEIASYNKVYKELNNEEPPSPLLAGWTICHEDADTAKNLAKKYIGGYWQTVLDHYNFDTTHLKNQKGYEYYGKFAENMKKTGVDGAVEFFMSLQTWGTPDDCLRQIESNCSRIGAEAYIGVFSFAGMPIEIARANIGLFSKKVLPKLKAKSITGNIDWAA